MTPRSVLRSTLPVAMVATIFLAACGDDDSSGDAAATTAAATATTAAAATTEVIITVAPNMDPLDGTAWTLDMVTLGVEGGDSVVVSIAFANGSVTGSSGCNTFSGTYELSGETITLSPLISTQIVCQDPQAAVEAVVLERLGQVQGFSQTAGDLILTDANGEALLRYFPGPTGVEGNWIATSYLKADGSAITSIAVGTEITAAFQADGTVAGSSGCNTYNGPYTVGEDAITIGPLASTRIACPDPAGAQEIDYLTALQSARTFTNDGAILTLFNEGGQIAVTFNTFSAG